MLRIDKQAQAHTHTCTHTHTHTHTHTTLTLTCTQIHSLTHTAHTYTHTHTQLEKLIAKNYYLHRSARDGYRSYLQAYASHSLKSVFNVELLDLQRVAKSFGFSNPPSVSLSILMVGGREIERERERERGREGERERREKERERERSETGEEGRI